jgi:hypothetical protein
LLFATENPQQGRLSRAVAPEQADPLQWLDATANLVEQRRAAKPNAQIGDCDQWHGRIRASRGYEIRATIKRN